MKNGNRLLLVFKYLFEQTDKQHQASLAEINSYLRKKDMDADRKTLTECIEDLRELGYDIQCIRSRQNLYYLNSRQFSLAAVKMLTDAVQSSRFISEEASRELVEKLASLVGEYSGEILKRHLYIGSRIKSENTSVSQYVESIYKAIEEKKKISFEYFEYSPTKERVLKSEGYRYLFSPYALIWNNDQYYAVGYSDKRQHITKFRLDRMNDLRVEEVTAVAQPDTFDISEFYNREFQMMHGEVCEVQLLCENSLMDSIVDKFGKEVKTEIADSDHFIVTVSVELTGTFFGWVFASEGKMRIIGPHFAVEEFKKIIQVFMT